MSRRAIGLVVACVGIGALMVPSFAGAVTSDKDVLVVNGPDRPVPVQGLVEVKNTVDVTNQERDPLFVHETGASEIPFQQVLGYGPGPGNSISGCADINVPADKTLRIDAVNYNWTGGADPNGRVVGRLVLTKNSVFVARIPVPLFEHEQNQWSATYHGPLYFMADRVAVDRIEACVPAGPPATVIVSGVLLPGSTSG